VDLYARTSPHEVAQERLEREPNQSPTTNVNDTGALRAEKDCDVLHARPAVRAVRERYRGRALELWDGIGA